MSEGPSESIARHLASLEFEDLPPATVVAAKHVLLDAVGVMLGASGIVPEVQPFVAIALAGGEGASSILGTGKRATAAAAALANGAMAHALDFEDAFDLAPGHPNASLVPALIALAQSRGNVSGREFITALAAGGDVSCRLALALDRPMEQGNWYPPPITAGLGAAAGAGLLLSLDAVRMLDCLSLALCQVTMPGEIKHSARTVLRAVREAFPAQAAVQSALLAEAGVSGFEKPLEGEGGFYALYAGGQFSPQRLLDGLGNRFWIEQLTFKPWPSCRGTHPFIEAALTLRDKGVRAEDIASGHLAIDPVQSMLVEPEGRKWAPAVAIDAKFSIPFCTALALVRGHVTLDDFTADSLADPVLLQTAAKMSFAVAPEENWQRGSGGALRVLLKDGRSLSAEVAAARGAPSNPLSEAALRVKFVECVGRAQIPLGWAAAERLAEEILSLETCDDVGALFA